MMVTGTGQLMVVVVVVVIIIVLVGVQGPVLGQIQGLSIVVVGNHAQGLAPVIGTRTPLIVPAILLVIVVV